MMAIALLEQWGLGNDEQINFNLETCKVILELLIG